MQEKNLSSNRLQSQYENYYESGNEDEWRRLGAQGKSENIIALCNDLPHDSILEIGAGEGSILQRLSELEFGKETYAIEISSSGVEAISNKHIPHLVEAAVFDGYNIPYAKNKFDLAILSHVVEHVEHPRLLIYEASRIAKYLYVEVPLDQTLRLPTRVVFEKTGHINYYCPKTIKMLLQSCGLEVIDQIVINPSKATATYHNGKKGLIQYFVKKYMLKFLPNVAPHIATYHSALVCKKKD